MDFFSGLYKPVVSVFDNGADNIIPNLMKCTNLLEFCASSGLALITCQFASNSIQVAVAFSVLYVLFGNQLKMRLRANPVLSFCDFMAGSNGSGCDVFWQIIMQCLGWTFGLFLGGIIGLTSQYSSADVSGDFSTLVFDEFLSCAVLVWIWLHIHDNNDSWKEFLGLAVGLALWLADAMSTGNAHMNPAIMVGQDMNNRNLKNWTLANFSGFFTPIISAFVTSLVYHYFKK